MLRTKGALTQMENKNQTDDSISKSYETLEYMLVVVYRYANL